jgi:hypothetical protein
MTAIAMKMGTGANFSEHMTDSRRNRSRTEIGFVHAFHSWHAP